MKNRAILQKKNGETIARYESQREVTEAGYRINLVRAVLRGDKHEYDGYSWEYADGKGVQEFSKMEHSNTRRAESERMRRRGFKYCKCCDRYLPIGEFSINTRGKRSHVCKSCATLNDGNGIQEQQEEIIHFPMIDGEQEFNAVKMPYNGENKCIKCALAESKHCDRYDCTDHYLRYYGGIETWDLNVDC